MGSNSEFLKEARPVHDTLDEARLYLVCKDGDRELQLLPLIQIGPTPPSATNACYFYNRNEQGEYSYVSYHFIDLPERKYRPEDVREILSLLRGNNDER
jgi:hypothetical protein